MHSLMHAHLHTHIQLLRPPGVLYCQLNPLSFMWQTPHPPSHFPTESLTPSPPDHWHLSPPILTHSFLLARLCRTPAITSALPTRLHGSVIGRC